MMHRILTLGLVMSAVGAADQTVEDIRLGIDFGVTYSQEWDFNYPAINKQEFDTDVLALSLSYIRNVTALSTHGYVFAGGQLHYEQQETESKPISSISIESQTELMGVGLQVGYAYPIPGLPSLHTEIGLLGSYFIGAVERTYHVSPVENHAQSYDGYGFSARLGGYYAVTEYIQIGAQLVYVLKRSFNTSPDYWNASLDGEEHDGLLIGLSVGCRL